MTPTHMTSEDTLHAMRRRREALAEAVKRDAASAGLPDLSVQPYQPPPDIHKRAPDNTVPIGTASTRRAVAIIYAGPPGVFKVTRAGAVALDQTQVSYILRLFADRLRPASQNQEDFCATLGIATRTLQDWGRPGGPPVPGWFWWAAIGYLVTRETVDAGRVARVLEAQR